MIQPIPSEAAADRRRNWGAATSGSDISEEETVTEDHEVSETRRKEYIDGPDTDGTSGTTR